MKEKQFTVGSLTLSALVNHQSGKTVIGLHGFLDNAESMRVLSPYLNAFNFIALDMAGHGLSQHRGEGAHYNQIDYVQDLHGLIESEGWNDVILVGHSLGGIVASIYAGLFPDKVAALVSIDACGPLTKAPDTTVMQMRDSINSRLGKDSSKEVAVEFENAVKGRCRVSDMSEAHAAAIMKRSIGKNAEGKSIWLSDARLRTKSTTRLTENQAETIVRSIACPVLIIGATRSFKQLNHAFEKRKSWFKNAQYCEFVGGHHIHMENSRDVGAKIRSFVEQM